MTNWFTYEFQAKHFRFEDCPQRRFYTSQWTNNPWVMLVIKAFFLCYWMGWFIASVVLGSTNYWIFLTNWGVVALFLYFFSSFAVVTHGVAIREKWQHPVKRKSAVNAVTRSESVPVLLENEKLRWFHIITWMFHIVALDAALLITILYWSLLETNSSAVSVNTHAINTVIMILDLFLINIPVRLLHFIHLSIFAVLYTVFSLILHGSGYNSAIYGVLNWQTNPGLAAGLCVAMIVVGAVVSQSVMFGLYHLRWFIARKTVLKEDAPQSNVTLAMETDNPAFEKP